MPARITDEALRGAYRDVERLGIPLVWLIDTTPTESFASSVVRVASGEVLPALQKKGLRRIVAIIKSPALRMATRAAALATTIEVKVVESRLEAASHLTWQK
ncbi:MAG: hypothetical protein U0441_22945 [Polyangiaceae bacterium]